MSAWWLLAAAALVLALVLALLLLRKRKGARWRVPLAVLAALCVVAAALFAVQAVRDRTRTRRMETTALVCETGELPDGETLLAYGNLRLLDLRGRTDVDRDYVAAARQSLPADCVILWSVPLTDGVFDSDSTALVLPGLTEQDAALLPCFPLLSAVDASGSAAYGALYDQSLAMPEVAFTYTLPLGDAVVSNTDTAAAAVGAPDWELLLSALSAFPRLESLDLRQADAPNDRVMALMDRYPGIDVRWHVRVGARTADSRAETVSFAGAGLASAGDALKLLACFPCLTAAEMDGCGLDVPALDSVAKERPDLSLAYTAQVLGKACRSTDTELDLRDAEPDAARLQKELASFPRLETAYLPDGMPESELAPVLSAYPDVFFVRNVTVLGRTLRNDATELDVSGEPVTTEDAEQALALLPRLEKLVMCRCGPDDAAMAALAAAHPGVKLVWEVEIGPHRVRTDATGFSTRNPSKYTNPNATDAYNEKVRKAKRLRKGDLDALRYCTDLVALDVGHNYLTDADLEVLRALPRLQILILADNKITDISALASLRELVYVELFMNDIQDVTPLVGLPKLLDVNVCNINLVDPAPLALLTHAERLWFSMNEYSAAEAKAIADRLPNCECNYTVRDETGGGWREHERYDWMRSFFPKN